MSDGATDANHTDHVSELLEGQHVRLWPYFRGVYPRNTLASLWQVMEADQAVEKVFHAQPKYGRQETPYPIRGDLISFVRYFEPDQEGTRLLLVAQAVESGEVAGMFWFDDIIIGHKANANIWYRRKFWGHPAREASRIACRYGFEVLGYQAIWALTPWRTAVAHGESMGFEPVTVLPGYLLIDDHPADLTVMKLTREDL
ncbi:MAG TPA: GNAT family protein [Gemmataceae bacterium]|nr:GNAT family protein [Gemmataceae bacterium]